MAKRALFIGIISLVILAVALMAQAQDATPDSQATVDAAVSTLIAQTQQAPQMLMTQTIQSALEQALTATAQPAAATPVPAATEQAFDASSLTISGTTDLDLLAGPAGTSAYLAPDGEHFAYFQRNEICIYEGDQQGNCTDLSDTMRAIDSESARWSPDSRYLAFTEDFFRFLNDADIWVLDTMTNKVTNVTDDGITKIELSGSDWKNIDLVPHWTADGQIVYLRYSRISGQIMSPEVHRIAPDGSGDTLLGTLNSNDDPFSIYNFDVNGDKLTYAYASQGGGSPSDGIWISDLDGQNARQLTHQSEKFLLTGVEFSPDARFILVNVQEKDFSPQQTAENSRLYVVDASSGKLTLIDPERNVTGAGWSPTGSALVYITHDYTNPDPDAVFLTNTPGVAGQELTALQGTGTFNMPTPLLQRTIDWGANNTILLSHSPSTGIVLVHLE